MSRTGKRQAWGVVGACCSGACARALRAQSKCRRARAQQRVVRKSARRACACLRLQQRALLRRKKHAAAVAMFCGYAAAYAVLLLLCCCAKCRARFARCYVRAAHARAPRYATRACHESVEKARKRMRAQAAACNAPGEGEGSSNKPTKPTVCRTELRK